MNKKRVLINVLIVGGTLICMFPWLVMHIFSSRTEQAAFPKNIYTDLSSLDFLEQYEIDSQNIQDEALGDLKPTDSYVATVEYQNRKYKIYAYIFRTYDGAHDYYLQATGIEDTMYATGLYYTYTNGFSSNHCAYYENCVFRVEGGGFNRFCEFMEWLSKDFPIDIREKFYEEFGYWLPV